MSKALEAALEAVRRMAPESTIEPALWLEVLEEMQREVARSRRNFDRPL